jgi:hypothetical protein
MDQVTGPRYLVAGGPQKEDAVYNGKRMRKAITRRGERVACCQGPESVH